MAVYQSGALRLFRVAGIDVMIHWSWILLAVVEVQFHDLLKFQSWYWDIGLFFTIFAVAMLHEIGHVTACRQVGGTADRILLQPFGGRAVVTPPPRPGPYLWTAAGGPLVNLLLIPVSILLCVILKGEAAHNPDLTKYLWWLTLGNIVLLVLNLMPVFPNDGGQMLYACLWAIFGRGPGLMLTSLIGLVGGGFLCGLCLLLVLSNGEPFFLFPAAFAFMFVMRSLVAFNQGRRMMRVMSGPRHREPSCPACRAHPLLGQHWVCDECHSRFDTFETLAECPQCFKRFEETGCPECGHKHSIIDWFPRRKRTPVPEPTPVPTEKTPYRPTDEWDKEMPREYS